MIEFTYTANSQSVESSLDLLLDAAADYSEALDEIAADFREMVARQFATEGRADSASGGWPPLAPSTARRKRANTGLLVSSGMLARSLGVRGAEGGVEEKDAFALTLGTRVPYAGFHQVGTRRMPARPLLALSGARAEKWTEIEGHGIERASVLGKEELGGGSR